MPASPGQGQPAGAESDRPPTERGQTSMSKIDEYRQVLRELEVWEPFLLEHSGLPGPRGNLELAQAAADVGSRDQFEAFLAYIAEIAPTNDPHEFLAFCRVVGLGRVGAGGERRWLPGGRRHSFG